MHATKKTPPTLVNRLCNSQLHTNRKKKITESRLRQSPGMLVDTWPRGFPYRTQLLQQFQMFALDLNYTSSLFTALNTHILFPPSLGQDESLLQQHPYQSAF